MCSGYSHLHVCIAGVYLQSVTSFCTVLMVSLEAQRLILRKSSLLVFSPFSGFCGPCIFACPHVMEILHLLTVSLLVFSHMVYDPSWILFMAWCGSQGSFCPHVHIMWYASFIGKKILSPHRGLCCWSSDHTCVAVLHGRLCHFLVFLSILAVIPHCLTTY